MANRKSDQEVQAGILSTVVNCRAKGEKPKMRNMVSDMSVSNKRVKRHIGLLESGGYLKRDRKGLYLTERGLVTEFTNLKFVMPGMDLLEKTSGMEGGEVMWARKIYKEAIFEKYATSRGDVNVVRLVHEYLADRSRVGAKELDVGEMEYAVLSKAMSLGTSQSKETAAAYRKSFMEILKNMLYLGDSTL